MISDWLASRCGHFHTLPNLHHGWFGSKLGPRLHGLGPESEFSGLDSHQLKSSAMFYFSSKPNSKVWIRPEAILRALPLWEGLNGCGRCIAWRPSGRWSWWLLWLSEEPPHKGCAGPANKRNTVGQPAEHQHCYNENAADSERRHLPHPLTVLSRPWMWSVTDFAFLLEELMKNWDFFLLCDSGVDCTGLAGALRMSNTSCAKAVMSRGMSFLCGEHDLRPTWEKSFSSARCDKPQTIRHIGGTSAC